MGNGVGLGTGWPGGVVGRGDAGETTGPAATVSLGVPGSAFSPRRVSQ